VQALRRRMPELHVSVSATTRPPREGERDGEHYRFLDDAAFDQLIADGGLLEWASYAGHRYGTPVEPVRHALDEGHTVVLEIDVQGARQVRERVPEALLVFLKPPSLEALEERLRGRGTESVAAVAARLDRAVAELAAEPDFDAVVVNDDLDAAVAEVVRILGG
jgi:guanylate kinase